MSSGQQLSAMAQTINKPREDYFAKVLDVTADVIYSKIKAFITGGKLIPFAQAGGHYCTMSKYQLFKANATYFEVRDALDAFFRKYSVVAGVKCVHHARIDRDLQGVELYW